MSTHQHSLEEIPRFVADGADGYRLLSADNELIGWIRGSTIGVSGFDDEDAAISAAIRAYCVLAVWLEAHHLHPLPELGDGVARLTHDGAYRWLHVNNVPVARLPTATPYDPGTRTHAFEIPMKGAISEGMRIHAALVTLRAAHGQAADAVPPAGRNDVLGARRRRAPATTTTESEAS